ncbi:MAG: tRNA (N(6)-L-threonylcarbamoyladenosine(37)-C(2))-methylthiotransferase MtaB [Hyphomicrobiaceae bacterium]
MSDIARARRRQDRGDSPDDTRIVTLGCRLNAYESEVMRAHLDANGLDDVTVVNTCAVTAEAVRQARQTIRRLRRERPATRIVVTGCAVQIDPDTFGDMAEVDHVVGNAEKLDARTFEGLATGASERLQVNDIMSVRETAGQLIDGFGTRSRAYVQVQNGCDHRCTFCIIPFGRGPSRSVPAGEVVNQIRRLVEQGYAEVVLTGVDMTSYGPDLPGNQTLGSLVRQILRHVPDLQRLRLSSIDQVEIDPDLLTAIAEEPRLMPHLHLSMQAGADLTLKRMKRRHLRADAIGFCSEARRLRPDMTFGADLIAGFPTETEAMFQDTLDIVDACGLTYLHVFPFSPRPGTPAERMPQVAPATIKQRAARLRAKGEARLAEFLRQQIGNEVDVLVERPNIGRTPQFAEVRLDKDPAQTGTITRTKIAGSDGRRLLAET